jgi:hypothetical protein
MSCCSACSAHSALWVTERHGTDEILNAVAEAFLLLLVSGARAIWRSNNEPPTSKVGVTAVGGLAGEDLAKDFAAILADQADALDFAQCGSLPTFL